MRRRTSSTTPSRTRTCSAPSPSTRASAVATRMRSVIGEGVEGAVQAHDVALGKAVRGHPRAERARIRRLHRPEAAEAAAVVARAQRAAARVRDRAEARRAVRDGDADVPGALALDAHAVGV